MGDEMLAYLCTRMCLRCLQKVLHMLAVAAATQLASHQCHHLMAPSVESMRSFFPTANLGKDGWCSVSSQQFVQMVVMLITCLYLWPPRQASQRIQSPSIERASVAFAVTSYG